MGLFNNIFGRQTENHRSESRVNFYITGVTADLFDDSKRALKDRIDGYDFHERWFALVAFVLFVIKIAHQKTDSKGKELINKGINFYISDESNGESYINYFGSPEFGNYIYNYKSEKLIHNVKVCMKKYSEVWNKNIKSDPNIAVSMKLGEIISQDKNKYTLAFNYLYKQFSVDGSNGTFKLFNCKNNNN